MNKNYVTDLVTLICLETGGKTKNSVHYGVIIVGRIGAQFLHNRKFCEKKYHIDRIWRLYASMNIRYGEICKKLEFLTF